MAPILTTGAGVYKSAVSAGSFTTLDDTATATGPGPGIVLSPNKLTASSVAGVNCVARSFANYITGKYYCEFTVNSASNFICGVCFTAYANYEYMGQHGGATGLSSFSTTYFGGSMSGTTTCPIATAGHTYAMACDFDTHEIWIKDLSIATPLWNSNATANPTGNVNGAQFGGGFLPWFNNVHVSVTPGGPGDSVTFNFGASAYLGTKPAGYLNW